MRYENELKVGVAIIFAIVVFVVGVRFFSSLPMFRGTYELVSEFDNVGGLMEGNAVTVNGVNVGHISDVSLNPNTQRVDVRFRVDEDVVVPEGSFTEVGGFAALGTIDMKLHLGPPGNPPLPPRSVLPSEASADLIQVLQERAPGLAEQVEGVLTSADTSLQGVQYLLGNPNSNLHQALYELRMVASTMNELLTGERERISRVLSGFENVTVDVSDFTNQTGDSLTVAVRNLNQVLSRLDQNLDSIERSSASLEVLLTRIEQGEGTAGQLINDPSLYTKLDSITTNLNRILVDFESDPGRYLREMRLIRIF